MLKRSDINLDKKDYIDLFKRGLVRATMLAGVTAGLYVIHPDREFVRNFLTVGCLFGAGTLYYTAWKKKEMKFLNSLTHYDELRYRVSHPEEKFIMPKWNRLEKFENKLFESIGEKIKAIKNCKKRIFNLKNDKRVLKNDDKLNDELNNEPTNDLTK